MGYILAVFIGFVFGLLFGVFAQLHIESDAVKSGIVKLQMKWYKISPLNKEEE